MGLQRYPLSPAIWGAGEEIRLTHVVQAALFTDFEANRATSYIDVDLEANPLTGSWRVRYNGAVIGTVPAEDRARFPDIERVHRSLLRPGTTAELRFNAATGQFDVAVILPPTQLAVPRNDTPAGAWVLPPGDMMVIDTAAGEFSAEELEMLSPGQWLVALHRIADTVVAVYDGRVLGGFTGDDALDLVEFVEEATALGAPEVYARAVLIDAMAALDVASPGEGPVLVPALSVPDSRPRRPWSVVDFPDGSWAVTVEHDYATDPDEEVKPLHTARYVSLAGGDRPAEMAAPTEIFGIVDDTPAPAPEPEPEPAPAPAPEPDPTPTESFADLHSARLAGFAPQHSWSGAGDYLTEVEKVQLRRQQRAQAASGLEAEGHHRAPDRTLQHFIAERDGVTPAD